MEEIFLFLLLSLFTLFLTLFILLIRFCRSDYRNLTTKNILPIGLPSAFSHQSHQFQSTNETIPYTELCDSEINFTETNSSSSTNQFQFKCNSTNNGKHFLLNFLKSFRRTILFIFSIIVGGIFYYYRLERELHLIHYSIVGWESWYYNFSENSPGPICPIEKIQVKHSAMRWYTSTNAADKNSIASVRAAVNSAVRCSSMKATFIWTGDSKVLESEKMKNWITETQLTRPFTVVDYSKRIENIYNETSNLLFTEGLKPKWKINPLALGYLARYEFPILEIENDQQLNQQIHQLQIQSNPVLKLKNEISTNSNPHSASAHLENIKIQENLLNNNNNNLLKSDEKSNINSISTSNEIDLSNYAFYTDSDALVVRDPIWSEIILEILNSSPIAKDFPIYLSYDGGAYAKEPNSGTFIMNLPVWRTMLPKWRNFVLLDREHFHPRPSDQSALMVFLSQEFNISIQEFPYLPLSLSWKPYWGYRAVLYGNVAVLHFISSKPWEIRLWLNRNSVKPGRNSYHHRAPAESEARALALWDEFAWN